MSGEALRAIKEKMPPDGSPFWINSPMEVKSMMANLIKKNERLVIWVDDEKFLISVPLKVSEDRLIIDCGVDERLNDRAVKASERLAVSTALDRIDIRFELSNLKLVNYENSPAFVCALPSRVHKLQRREYFRVPTPVVKPLELRVPVPMGDAEIKGKAEKFQVVDISMGGLCLTAPVSGHGLEEKKIYPQCSVALPDFGDVFFDLEICHIYEVDSKTGAKKMRAGCRFAKLGLAGQNSIQRYMAKLERERNGMDRW